MTPPSVRLADVALAAGVSLPTASQVMNGTGRVADETRRRVLDVARQLDYRPNALARSVALGRSQTIGVLAENAAGAFCMPVLIGVNRALSSHDLASLLFDARHDADVRRDHVRHMLDRQVDGIIVIGEGPDAPIAELGERFAGPVVHAFGPHRPRNAASIHPDQREGGATAARELLRLGRSRIAYISADDALPSSRERREGFEAVLAEAGLAPAASLQREFSRAWGHTATAQLLRDLPDVDGIFAGNDAIAIGVAATLAEHGRRVPDDVAIVGYDNVAGYSDDVEPYLTSIDPDLETVGERAAQYLITTLAGETADDSAIPPRLAVGASTNGGSDRARRDLVEALMRSTTAPPVIHTGQATRP